MDFAQLAIDSILFLVYSFVLILILVYIWRFWMLYANQKHINGLDWVMLEILLPREIFKSPVAFELVATALLQSGGVGNWHARKFKGALPAWFSLEIASLEGTVHFYIRTQKKFRPLLESNIYAQYPGIEVIEVEDYTKQFRYEHNKNEFSMWGLSYVLSSPPLVVQKEDEKKGLKKETMPADYGMIRTYVDLGLDKDPKEEFKNDPLSQTIEFLGSLKKGEYAGVQLLVQDASKFKDDFPATYVHPVTHKHMTLKEVADLRIKQIRFKVKEEGELVFDEYGYPKEKEIGKDTEGKPIKEQIKYQKAMEVPVPEMQMSKEEKDEIEEINRKLGKPIGRCVMRSIYVTKSTAFNPTRIQNLLSLTKPFSYPGFNGFRPQNLATPYDYPWQNTMKKREPWRAEEIFDAYVEREGFHPHLKYFDNKTGEGKAGDIFFFPYKGYVRRIARMIYEVIFNPFDHPAASEVFSLNLEEIATLYHFPGRTAATPTLPRIDSVKGMAPTNLPQ